MLATSIGEVAEFYTYFADQGVSRSTSDLPGLGCQMGGKWVTFWGR